MTKQASRREYTTTLKPEERQTPLKPITDRTLGYVRGTLGMVLGDQRQVEFDLPTLSTGGQTYKLPQRVEVTKEWDGTTLLTYTTLPSPPVSFEVKHREVRIGKQALQKLPRGADFVTLDERTGQDIAADLMGRFLLTLFNRILLVKR